MTLAERIAKRFRQASSRSVKQGPFTITIHPEVTPEEEDQVLKALAHASSLIARTKFSYVLGGKVEILSGVVIGAESFYASYTTGKDVIQLSPETSDDARAIHAIIHELGHRLESKWVPPATKAEFKRLLKGGPVEKAFSYRDRALFAETYAANLRSTRDDTPMPHESEAYEEWRDVRPSSKDTKMVGLLDQFFDEKDDNALKDLKEIFGSLDIKGDLLLMVGEQPSVQVSSYAKHDWAEQFAEAFTYYVLKKALPKRLADFMDEL